MSFILFVKQQNSIYCLKESKLSFKKNGYVVLLLYGRFAIAFSCIIAITNQPMLGEKTTVVDLFLAHMGH